MKWEYHLIKQSNLGSFSDMLKTAGEEGWELCGFDYGYAFLKRPIEIITDTKIMMYDPEAIKNK